MSFNPDVSLDAFFFGGLFPGRLFFRASFGHSRFFPDAIVMWFFPKNTRRRSPFFSRTSSRFYSRTFFCDLLVTLGHVGSLGHHFRHLFFRRNFFLWILGIRGGQKTLKNAKKTDLEITSNSGSVFYAKIPKLWDFRAPFGVQKAHFWAKKEVN